MDLARRWGAPRALGRALRVIGQATGGQDGIEYLQRATTALADSGARLEYAKSLLQLGAALRRAGRRAAAREALSRALDQAEICGAPVPASGPGRVADGRIPTAAAPAHRRRGVDPQRTTVARAAAGGATNREIAQSLFVTTKTVEVHLSSAFRNSA